MTLKELENAREDAMAHILERHTNRQIDKATYRTLRQAIHAAFDEANRRLLGAAQTSETPAGPTDAPKPEKAIPAPAPQPARTVEITYNGIKQVRRVDANDQIMAEVFEISNGRDRPTFGGDANEFLALKRAGVAGGD